MFTKNGKFKLYFWSIMLGLTLIAGLFGLYKHLKDTETERKLAKISKKTSERIIIEGNTLSKGDEETIKFIVTALFNDSRNELKENNNKLELSDRGKNITAAKYLFLKKEIDFNSGFTKTDSENVVKTMKDLFGDYIKYDKSFVINFSSDFCGSTGFDGSLNRMIGTGENDDTTSCTTPTFVFSIDKVKFDKDTYVALVYGAYADEVESSNLPAEGAVLSECQANETEFNRTVNLYTDKAKKNKVYNTDISGCCNSSKCSSAGISKIKSALTQTIATSGYKYYVRFNKNENGTFLLDKIEVVK